MRYERELIRCLKKMASDWQKRGGDIVCKMETEFSRWQKREREIAMLINNLKKRGLIK